jgi:hypothetical protein
VLTLWLSLAESYSDTKLEETHARVPSNLNVAPNIKSILTLEA